MLRVEVNRANFRYRQQQFIVTDGLRYGMFSRQSGEFGRYSDAYLNLNRMRNRYPIYGDCKGAAETLDEFVTRKKESMPDAFA